MRLRLRWLGCWRAGSVGRNGGADSGDGDEETRFVRRVWVLGFDGEVEFFGRVLRGGFKGRQDVDAGGRRGHSPDVL